MRLAYALTALALPAVGISVVELVRPSSAQIAPRAAVSTGSLAGLSDRHRFGEKQWDITQLAPLGAAFGRMRR